MIKHLVQNSFRVSNINFAFSLLKKFMKRKHDLMVLNLNKKAMCSTKKPLSHRNSKFKIVIVGFPFKEFSFINIGI